MKKWFSIFFLVFLFCPRMSESQTLESYQQKKHRMQWFKDAKLGIFIHWGIYAVNGIDESWAFFNGYISYEDYMKQLNGFTAKNYDPEQWASLIEVSGARYAVLTSKHHDGVALWKTKESDLNVVVKTPAGHDLIGPFVKALRKHGIKVGLYYSLLDWSHSDYPNFLSDKRRYDEDPDKWSRFVKFNFGQIEELSKQFKPDLFWFDGDWEQSAEKWKAQHLRENLFTWNPNVIINSRLRGYGDYATPEQGLPVIRPENEWWELCMTMNDSWGYQGNDKNYKSANQIIRIFIDCIANGGNLLLDIGPKEDGSIPEEQVDLLRAMGRWTWKHSEAIYETVAGIPHGHFYGPTTLSQDSTTLFLFLPHKPNGPVVVKGLMNPVNRIRVVGDGTKLRSKIVGKLYWSEVPGILYIDVPEHVVDEQVTVIAIQLKGKVELYRR